MTLYGWYSGRAFRAGGGVSVWRTEKGGEVQVTSVTDEEAPGTRWGDEVLVGEVAEYLRVGRRPRGEALAELERERSGAISHLREICAEFGDNDWPDELHLGDVLEKHLARPLRLREKTEAAVEEEGRWEPEAVGKGYRVHFRGGWLDVSSWLHWVAICASGPQPRFSRDAAHDLFDLAVEVIIPTGALPRLATIERMRPELEWQTESGDVVVRAREAMGYWILTDKLDRDRRYHTKAVAFQVLRDRLTEAGGA